MAPEVIKAGEEYDQVCVGEGAKGRWGRGVGGGIFLVSITYLLARSSLLFFFSLNHLRIIFIRAFIYFGGRKFACFFLFFYQGGGLV